MKRYLILFFVALSFLATPTNDSANLYAKNGVTAPAKKDVTVYVTRTGVKYHLSGCRYLRRSSIPMKLSEARKTYTACSVCRPPK